MDNIKEYRRSDYKRIDNLKSNFILPKTLREDEHIYYIEQQGDIVSFIFISVLRDSVHINYSFTKEEERCKGFNKKLRECVILYAKSINKRYVSCNLLPESNSIHVLNKLGFKKIDNQYIYEVRG